MKRFFALLTGMLMLALFAPAGCGGDDDETKVDAGVITQADVGPAMEDVGPTQDDIAAEAEDIAVVPPDMSGHTVDPLPAAAGPMIRITAMDIQNLGDPTASAALASMLGMMVDPFIADYTILLLAELDGLTDVAGPNGDDVTLKFYLGYYSPEEDAIYIDGDSLDELTGEPMITFPGATVTAGDLAAGPSDFPLEIPMDDEVLTFDISNVEITGTVAANVASLTDTTLAGVVYVQSLNDVMLPPEIADYIPGLGGGSLLGLLAGGVGGLMDPILPDFDEDGDGVERFETNPDTGVVETCYDCTCLDVLGAPVADCTCTTGEVVTTGADCVADPGIQDAYTISLTVEGEAVEPAGIWYWEE